MFVKEESKNEKIILKEFLCTLLFFKKTCYNYLMRKQANNLIIAILKKKGRIQMKEDRFIKEVAKKLKNGMCDLFVGSGISAPSKLPTWSDFLTPFLDDLDIQIKDGDDLPLLAQYVVNHNAGNRNIIAQAICDTFGRDYPINNYHRILSSFPICTIWMSLLLRVLF